MSIVPMSHLSNQERLSLGNNLSPRPCRRYRQRRHRRAQTVAAINRSLAAVGEQVLSLHKPLLVAS